MSNSEIELNDEEQIMYSCLDLKNQKSFFLFAGAGSGKTRSLVQVLKKIKMKNRKHLEMNWQKIAIITYTNAASDEIKSRLEYDSIFVVSTIHSFSWDLIKPFQNDIKEWLRENLTNEIMELEEAEKNGRAGTKTSIDRIAKIKSKTKRLKGLDNIITFSYNPNGANNQRDSLNHSEVINITSEFLSKKTLMQLILTKKFPILLIDESQDTKKELIESFFKVQKCYEDTFSLGLFGDTMQRIYSDGKIDLGKDIPPTWSQPKKTINYRCPSRIIKLINKIRSVVDSQQQIPNKTNEGFARAFIIEIKQNMNKSKIEESIGKQMSIITSDSEWNDLENQVKRLTLEHHMAARRSDFFDFFEPLHGIDSTGILDGTAEGVSFLINQVLSLYRALYEDNDFEVAGIIKKYSPLLEINILNNSKNQYKMISDANIAVGKFKEIWGENFENNPTLFEVLKLGEELKLFKLPETLSIIINREEVTVKETLEEENYTDEKIYAWETSLKTPFSQLEKYYEYISGKSLFGTHQGVKGLEFPRVMTILDDSESRGFLFSYDKLVGAAELTKTDLDNITNGKDNSVDRTRRLFYVTCSRAEESLAVVIYTKNPKEVKKSILANEWFEEEEIIVI